MRRSGSKLRVGSDSAHPTGLQLPTGTPPDISLKSLVLSNSVSHTGKVVDWRGPPQ